MFGVDTVINNDVTVKEFLKHGGVCHRNSKYSPAFAAEYCAAKVVMRLLLNEDDQYVGNDIAIFVDILAADNNTRSPKKFIHSQHQIIETPADNKAGNFPEFGYTLKIAATNSTP